MGLHTGMHTHGHAHGHAHTRAHIPTYMCACTCTHTRMQLSALPQKTLGRDPGWLGPWGTSTPTAQDVHGRSVSLRPRVGPGPTAGALQQQDAEAGRALGGTAPGGASAWPWALVLSSLS